MTDEPRLERVLAEPEVTMSAVKLDKDGNVVGEVEFNNIEASPGFLAQLKQAAQEGWAEGKANAGKDD